MILNEFALKFMSIPGRIENMVILNNLLGVNPFKAPLKKMKYAMTRV